MAKDEDQDKRLDKHETEIGVLKDDVADLKTDSKIMTLSMDNLGEKFDTGMMTLDGNLKATITGWRADAKIQREAEALEAQQAREDRKWWWGKVFTAVSSVIGIVSAAVGGWYALGPDAKAEAPTEQTVPVEHPHPRPAAPEEDAP